MGDQLTSITYPSGGSGTLNYTYIGPGEQQRVSAGSTKYQYDGTGLNVQTDSANNKTYFTTLPDGGLLSETIPTGVANAGTYYYLGDGAGNVAVVVDSTGTIRNSYSYDPSGAATVTGSQQVPNPFTFRGWMYDAQTGYYYTGSNYYDPATGQSFGCRDKGKVDPGEDCGCHHDSCGEDENAACGGVCSRSTTAIDAQTDAESPGRYGGGGGGPPGGTSPGTSTGAAVGAAEAYLTAQEEAEVEASAMRMVGKQGNVTRAYVKLQSHIERMYRGQRGQPEYRGLRASNDLALRIIRSAMQQGSTICHGSEQLLMFNDKGQGIRILLNDHKVVFDSFLSLDQWDGTCK